jgi:hypothetical protein
MSRGMAKLHLLPALKVERAKDRKEPPGRYGDGGGLYLQVGTNGGASWLFGYKRNR